jgi:PIN domain nuclease of toxin-antitoxin system
VDVLLDTQAFIYAADPQQGDRLPAKAKRAILNANRRFMSVMSVYEIALNHRKGKLQVDQKLTERLLDDLMIDLLPISPEHVFRSFNLPMHHSDPIDRLIIIAALEQDIPLIGGDHEFPKYKGLKVLWD